MSFLTVTKRLLFRLIWLGVVIFLILWAFISYTKAPSGQYLLIHSKFRQSILLKPTKWYFIPERILPRQVSIEKIPVSPSISGSIEVLLPYYQLLDSFGRFSVLFFYNALLPFEESQVAEFKEGEFTEILESQKQTLESIVNRTVLQLTSSVPFNMDVVIKKTVEELNKNKLKTDLSISQSSDLDFYQILRKDILAYDKVQQLNLREQKVQSAIKDQKEAIAIKLRKDKIDEYLDTVIEMTQKIQDSKVDSKTVLDILKFLMQNDTEKKS